MPEYQVVDIEKPKTYQVVSMPEGFTYPEVPTLAEEFEEVQAVSGLGLPQEEEEDEDADELVPVIPEGTEGLQRREGSGFWKGVGKGDPFVGITIPVGIVENVAELSSALFANIPGLLNFVQIYSSTGDVKIAQEIQQKVVSALTYEPRTQAGKAVQKPVHNAINAWLDVAKSAGNLDYDIITGFNNILKSAGFKADLTEFAKASATGVEVAIAVLPMLFGFKRGKGRTEEPLLEGEVIKPSDRALPPERGLEADRGIIVEGEVGARGEVKVLPETKKLPSEGKYELVPVEKVTKPAIKDVADTTIVEYRPIKEILENQGIFEKPIPLPTILRPDIEGIAPGIITRRLDVEKIVLDKDPYAPGGKLAGADIKLISEARKRKDKGPGGKQAGAIYPQEIIDGIKEVAIKIDESIIINNLRRGMQPLQGVPPEVAGWIKSWANTDFKIVDYTKNFVLKETSKWPKEERAAMYELATYSNMLTYRVAKASKGEPVVELSPRQLEFVEKLKEEVNVLNKLQHQMGIVKGHIEDYIPRIVKKYLDETNAGKKFFGTKKWKTYKKTFKRKYEKIEEGEAAGVEYVKDINLVIAARMEMERLINNKMHVEGFIKSQAMRENGLITFPGEYIQGYKTIDHPAFRETSYYNYKSINYKGKRIPVEHGKVRIEGKNYPVEKGQVIIGNAVRKVNSILKENIRPIYVHPNIKAAIEALIKDPTEAGFMTAAMKVKMASMYMIMYNPVFHGFTVYTKALPASFRNLYFADYFIGNKLNKNAAYRADAILHNLRPLGGRGYQMDLYGDIKVNTENWLHKIDSRFGDAVGKVGWFYHDFLLWDRVGDLQIGLYDRTWKNNIKKFSKDFKKKNNRNPRPEELEQMTENAKYAAGDFANLIVGAFGREDFAAGWRNFLNLTTFSRSFLMSNLRLGKYGLGIMPKHLLAQIKAVEGVKGFNSAPARRAWVGVAAAMLFTDLFLAFSAAQVGNFAFTKYNNIEDRHGNTGGHFTWDNEKGKDTVMGEYIAVYQKDNGQTVYMGNPFRAARDVAMFFQAPFYPKKAIKVLGHKISPSLKVVDELLNNEDWTGKTIFNDEQAWYEQIAVGAKHIAKVMSGYEGFLNSIVPSEAEPENRIRLLGIQISHGHRAGPEAGTIAYVQRQQAMREQHIKAEVNALFKRGKMEEGIKLMEDNGFTKDQIKNAINRYEDPKGYFYKGLKKTRRKLLRRATEKELELLEGI